MKWILQLALTLAFIACGQNPSLQTPSEPDGPGGSAQPIEGEGSTAKLSRVDQIRVLVFPHTLKSDRAHGAPDNAKRVTLESSQNFTVKFNGQAFLTKKMTFFAGRKLKFSFGGKDYQAKKVFIQNSKRIKIVRENALDKSHYYEGGMEVLAHNASKIRVINSVDMQTYLRGVVPSESLSSWPLDTLKAQTLAARSYAFYHYKNAPRNRSYHVDDTARFQVYTGLTKRDAKTDQAIRETDREVITHDGGVIVAYFHSYSGGFLEEAHEIFGGKKAPYTKKTREIFSNDELKEEIPERSQWIIDWEKTYSKQVIMRALKRGSKTKNLFKSFKVNQDYNVSIQKPDLRNDTGFKFLFTQGAASAIVGRVTFRSTVGWSKVLSYHFRIKEDGQKLKISGHGWGHHVGMSQFGAFMMAKRYGYNYREILEHYYRQIKIIKYPR